MARSRPNILWICTDSQRFDTLGCYGNEFVETPNIDRLASQGVRFDNCYTQSPVCTPSRASFLTGRYPRTTRVRQNGQPIPEDELLLPKILDAAGYTCGLAGKLHVSPNDSETMERRIDDGYSDFRWSQDTNWPWPTNEYFTWLQEQDVHFHRESFEGSEYVETSMESQHHQTTWCVQKAINFIETHSDVSQSTDTPSSQTGTSPPFDQPWLYSVNIFDPHHPFDPPQSYLERYLDDLEEIPLPNYTEGELEDKSEYQQADHVGAYNTDIYPFTEMDDDDHRLLRAAYWAMIDLIDDQIGRLIETLKDTNQFEDTIIIFTSDHGEMLGDHGIYLKGPYFYDPAVRVPLIVANEPRIEGGVESDALVELTDLVPTLLDAVGQSHPPGIQGRSLWSILTGEADPNHHREYVYSEYYNAMPRHEKPVLPYATMIRTERYKLVKTHRLDSSELYDLMEDPSETTNKWDDPTVQEEKLELLEYMTDGMAETVDPLPERKAKY